MSRYLKKQEFLNIRKSDDFTFNNQTFHAHVVSVYDGDTIRVVFRNNGRLEQHRARMIGYNAPELKPLKTVKNRQEIIEKARYARNELIKKIDNQAVKIHCGHFDKYGRILVVVETKTCKNVNRWMIDSIGMKPM